MARLIFVLSIAIVPSWAPRSLPAQEPGQVTIYRDPWGVPHVYAPREEDGFYGLGYAQAEDRLEGLLASYLQVRGEAASAFGADFVDRDFDQRLFRHLEESRTGLERVPAQLRRDYEAFVAGIQGYMDQHPDRVPDWAPTLEPALPMAALRSFLWSRLLFDGVVYWARPGPRDGKCARRAGGDGRSPSGIRRQASLDGPGWRGSNEWVLMPGRTADGVVIHLGDPHGGYHGAWEFRIDAGPVKAAASSFPGIPLPFIGHTRHVAWAFTLFGTDGFDCYAVVTDPDDPLRYRYDGEWEIMATEEATVAVSDGLPQTRTLTYTRHNGILSPVVGRSADTAFVLSIPDMHRAGLMDEQFYGVALARSMDEFKDAIDPGFISANVMAGSADGHAFYVRGGYVPRRPDGHDFRGPVPGNTSATAWLGMHTLEEHVTLEDPPAGYMSNNNIAPDRMLESGSPDLARYAWYLYDDEPGRTTSRGIRAIQVLSRAYDVTVEGALELALDDKWIGVERWQERLRAAALDRPGRVWNASAEFRAFLGRLLAFDGFARKESREALAFYYWWETLRSDTTRFRSLRSDVESGQPHAEEEDVLLTAVQSALEALRARHGTIDVSYGDEFRAGRGGASYPVGSGPLPGLEFLDGVVPLRATSFTPIDENNQRWAVGGGYHTTLTIFTAPIQSYSLAPLGQSSDPASPHHSDQALLMSERRLKPTLFYLEDLLEVEVTSVTLDVPPF